MRQGPGREAPRPSPHAERGAGAMVDSAGALVAQWIEHRFPKPGVGCSIQPGGTTFILLRAIFYGARSRTKPRIGRNADILPTRLDITRRDTRPRGITAAACRRRGRVFCSPRMPLVRTW